MALWRWLADRLNLTDLKGWRQVYGYEDDSGEHVTPDGAMKLSAWWSARRLITETIATLPGGMFHKDGDDRRSLPGHFLYPLLQQQPNADQNAVEWWEGRIGPLCTVGNSYAEKRYLGDRLVALQPMKTDDTRPHREPDGRLVYKFNDRGKTETLPKDKVFHIRGFGEDGDEGLSPVSYAARSLGGAIAAEKAAARVYSKGLRGSGVFKTPQDMDKKQRDDFFKNYVQPMEGLAGQGRSIVLPPGFDWVSMNISPRDAELLLTRGFSVEDVCRWMGIPPILIGHAAAGQTMWGSGIEQIILGWLVLGLRAYLKRVEAAVNTRLLPVGDRANGIYYEINFEGLLRADSVGRAALFSALAQNGLRNRNELRKLDNMPSFPGGEVFTVQSNLTPLDQLMGGQQSGAEAVRNALRAWLLDAREEEERKAA